MIVPVGPANSSKGVNEARVGELIFRICVTIRDSSAVLELSIRSIQNSDHKCKRPAYTFTEILNSYQDTGRPGSVVGRSGDPVSVGARFSAPVQTGPEAHPASCTMGTGSLPVVWCGRGVTLTPSSAEVKNRVELYLYSP
jgi:hypothetical protein